MLASDRNGTLYAGVTNDSVRRVWEHKNKTADGFTNNYGVDRLVYFQHFDNIANAIREEKRLKAWRRKWKIELIEKTNPQWRDLYDSLNV